MKLSFSFSSSILSNIILSFEKFNSSFPSNKNISKIFSSKKFLSIRSKNKANVLKKFKAYA